MNVPIFFTFYMIGYLFCAVCIDVVIANVSEQPEQYGQHQWMLRKQWQYRLLTSRWSRFVIALYSLVWPWIMLGGFIQAFRQMRQRNESFDFNGLRHCADPLHEYCGAVSQPSHPDEKPWWLVMTIDRCESDRHLVRGADFYIVSDVGPLCVTMFSFIMNRCRDADHYDPVFCHEGFLQ